MKRGLFLLIILFLIFSRLNAQKAVTEGFNYSSFTSDKKVLTSELDSLTSSEFKSHPEYGVLPYNAPCNDCIELLQQRDENHRYFVEKGSKGKVFYSQSSYGSLSYYDERGFIRTIDSRMKPAGRRGVYKAMNQPNPVTINISDKYTALLNAGKELQVNRDVTIYVQHKDGSVTPFGKPDWSNYTAGDDGVVIHNFYPGIDLELQSGRGRVESFYRVNKPLSLGDGWLVIRDNMKVPKNFSYDYSRCEMGANNMYTGTVFINDPAGTPYFYIGAPAAYDENGQTDNVISLAYRINSSDVFDLYVPIDWMNDPGRSYPLRIDPYVSIVSTVPQATITGSGYNATCFATGCSYNLPVKVPAATIITDISTTFWFLTLGSCWLSQGAWDISTGSCRYPSAGTFNTCNINIPGRCQLPNTTCYNWVKSCIPGPQCQAYTIPFTMTFYRCIQPGAGCGFSCVIADSPWDMTVKGYYITVTAPPQTVCEGSSVTLTATADSGIAPYTYKWYPGGLTGSSVSVSPTTTTTYTVTARDCPAVDTLTDSAQTTVLVTVIPNDNPGFVIAPNPACQNTPVTVSGLGSGSATYYDWILPGSNRGIQNDSQVVNNIIYASSGSKNVILNYTSGSCTFPDTQQVTITPSVTPGVTIAALPNTAICPGDNVTFTANVTNGGSAPTYQWYINGSPVSGATTNPFSSTTLNDNDVVSVHIKSNAPCAQPDSAVSNLIVMDVNPTIVPGVSIVVAPDDTICPGTAVTFTPTTNQGGSAPDFQWYINGVAVPGATNFTFTTSTINNGDQVSVHMLNSNVTCISPDSAVSNIIKMVYSPNIVPSVSIVASPSDTICPGGTVTFTAAPKNGGLAPAYQWYVNGNPVGTNSKTYSSSSLVGGDVVTVHLRNAVGPCIAPDSAISNAITIVISPLIAPTVSIAVAPSDTICPGTNVTFTATPTNGGSTPVYQWYLNGNPVGTNSSTYSSSSLVGGDAISVHLKNAIGPCIFPDSAVSNIITIVISSLIPPTVSISVAPSDTICPGDNVTFTATPVNGGGSPNYQWYLNGNPVGTNISTFSSSTLVGGDAISVHLRNATGPCIFPDTAVSNTITIVIAPLTPPTVSIVAAPDSICPGENITFTATPVNGGSAPAYQWYVNGTKTGTNNSVFSSTTLNNGDVVLVHLLNAVGRCIDPDSAVSNSIAVIYKVPVVPSVSIVAAPPGIICQGQTVSFTATPVNGGGSPSYQWYVNSTPSGTNSASFSYSSFKNGDTVTVAMTSSDPCANPKTVVSNQIIIQMYPPMNVTADGDTTICPGESVPLSSVAGGGQGPPYSYSWNNGAGTDSVTLVAPTATTIYTISATDGCGSTPATANVTVTVTPAPVPDFIYNPTEPTEYSRLVYFTDQSSGATSWSWNFGDSKSTDDTSSLRNPKHLYSGVGTYKVTLVVRNAGGCIDSIVYILEVTEEYAYYIPNAFTPNGDGVNDYFGPLGTHDLIYTMAIYNRWGEKIFETENTSLPWNGQVTGSDQLAEAGVYVYRVRFKDSRYTSEVLVGSVTLVR